MSKLRDADKRRESLNVSQTTRRNLLRGSAAMLGGTLAAMAIEPLARASTPHLGRRVLPATRVRWVATTQDSQWQTQDPPALSPPSANTGVEVLLDNPVQLIVGFGACFNELGWLALNALTPSDRDGVMRELFAPGVGTNFTLCRMPVGANDFSRDWYSYDETPDDFELRHFSISNDLATLVPFIQSAQRYNSDLRLWASPWGPPTWMKYNKHYAEVASFPGSPPNGLRPEQVGKEGTDMFIQQEKYFQTYANYFSHFIQAYKRLGIHIGMVMPQNEFNSAQPFPSCTWTAEGLAKFMRLLGPQMKDLGVQLFFGTLERPTKRLLDTAMADPVIRQSLRGVGLQWAGKGAIAEIHSSYPGLQIYQSEQECGDGRNDWKYCVYAWSLMRKYLLNGANAYMYWNIALRRGGLSRWGWAQNSLVTVDTDTRTFRYNYEFYLMKHLSHFVKMGARRLETSGADENVLAFENDDRTVAVILYNSDSTDKPVQIKVGESNASVKLRADSFNTLLFQPPV